MGKCPDILTIQTVIDGEEKGQAVQAHLVECAACRQQYRTLKEVIGLAGCLSTTVKLPASFYKELSAKTEPRPFPAAAVAAALFAAALASSHLANPGFLQWWFSVGITRQLGFFFDAFLDLLFMSHALGPAGVIPILATLVALEVLILNHLSNAEGKNNAQAQ